MKLPCAVVRDLLSLYAENLTEDETKQLVDEHLKDCADCRRILADIDTGTPSPVETAKPLMNLKKEIRKRRWCAAAAAALLVFIGVYTWFYHMTEWKPVPWEEGLIEAAGTEEKPYGEVYGQADPSDGPGTVEVLILRVDSRINGTRSTMFKDEDGTATELLQGWTSGSGGNFVRDYNEMIISPVPDRLIYQAGEEQHLVWGKPLSGGVMVLPRLALSFYVMAALALALILGAVWFFLRRYERSWIPRQLFFAPVSYLAAHFLIKGTHAESFFMERDLVGIVLIAAALYALLSLAWQLWTRHGEPV